MLRPDGLLLFADTHPMIEAKGKWKSSGFGAPIIIENYFQRDRSKWQIQYSTEKTITLEYCSRTIEQCVNMIADAGLKILRMVEPRPRRDLRKSDPAHYDRCSRIPYFIIYLAQKPLQPTD